MIYRPSGDEARAARAEVEAALDDAASSSGWPWRPALSRWVDALVLLEGTSSS